MPNGTNGTAPVRRNSKPRPNPTTLAIATGSQGTFNGPPSAQALVGVPAPSAAKPTRQASNHNTHPYSNVAVHTGSDYAGRTMTDGSFANTGANTPTAVYGRQSPMVATAGVSNVHAIAQPGFGVPQHQHQQELLPQKKEGKGIFGLLCRCG